MIEIFKFNNKWRIKIVNETLEFEDMNDMTEELSNLIQTKEEYEPYKK